MPIAPPSPLLVSVLDTVVVTNAAQIVTGLVTIAVLLLLVQVSIPEPRLRDTISVGLGIFAVIFVFLGIQSLTQYGTVVFRGSNSYTQFATEMAARPLTELGRPPDNDYYFVFLTVLYKAGSLGRILPILTNAMTLCYLIVFTYRLTKILFGERQAANASTLLVAFPTIYLHTYSTRSDMLTAALVVGILYVLTLLHHRFSHRLLGQLGVYFSLIIMLRIQLAALILLVITATLLFDRVSADFSVKQMLNTGVLSAVAGTVMFGFVYVVDFWGVRSLSLRQAIQRVLTFQVEPGAGLSSIVYTAPPPVRLLLGILTLFITPFPPWETIIASQSMTFFTVGGLAFFGLAPFALVGLTETIQRVSEDIIPLTLYTTAMTGVLALVYGGFASKFRLLLIPPLAIFASVGMEYAAKYRYAILLFFAGYPVLIVLYVLAL